MDRAHTHQHRAPTFPTANAHLEGLSLSRPPSFPLSEPHQAGTPPSSAGPAHPQDIWSDLVDELFEDSELEEDIGDITLVDAAATVQEARKKRRRRSTVMNEGDVKAFLRFMSTRELTISSLLRLFFDNIKVPIPVSDDLINSDDTIPDTESSHESYSSAYLRTRISQWLSTAGPASLTSRWKGAFDFSLSLVTKRLNLEARKGAAHPYLCGPSAGKTTIKHLVDFDPELSSQIVLDQFPTIHAVLSSIADNVPVPAAPSASRSEASSQSPRSRAEKEGAHPPTHFEQYGRRSRSAVIASTAHSLLFARNDRCNQWPLQLTVDLLSAKVPRRSLEFLARLGFVASYTSGARVLESMAQDDHKRTLALIRTGIPVSISYDNVNWQRGVRHKTTDKKVSMMAAVCGAAYVLDYKVQYDKSQPICSDALFRSTFGHDMARPKTTEPTPISPMDADGNYAALRRPQRDARRKEATPHGLTIHSLLGGREDDEHMLEVAIAHAARAWVRFHPESAISDGQLPQPPQVFPFLPQQTTTLGLPVLNEDEGSVAGSVAVLELYLQHLGISSEESCQSNVRPVVADAFSVLHVRSGQARRLHDLSTTPGKDKLEHLQPWSAFFHLQYTFQKYIQDAHAGTVQHQNSMSTRVLCDCVGMKKLCTANNLDFHDMDDYIKTLFVALVDILISPALSEVIPRPKREQEFADLSPDQLVSTCRSKLANLFQGSAESIALMHGEPEEADLLYLHAREILRDAAIYLELRDAVKRGDPGRVLVACKFTVPRFSATGHNRYTSEVLEMLIQVRDELPPALKPVMLAATLVNNAGKGDSWLPADLDIEHQVNELKNVLKITASSDDVVKKGQLGQIITTLRRQRVRWYRAIFDWQADRTNKAFELYRGDDVRQRKAAKEKNAKQAKGVATDYHVYGLSRLEGVGGDSGLFADWIARRSQDMGKNHATPVKFDPTSEERDLLTLDDIDVDIDALVSGTSSVENEAGG